MRNLRRLLSILLLCTAAANAQGDASLWQAQPSLPGGIAGFALGVREGALHVAGGTAWEADKKLTLDRRWSWRPGAASWTEQPRLPRAFAFGASGHIGNRLVLAAGSDGTSTCDAVVSVDGAGTSQALGRLPRPFAYGGNAADGNILYLIGGTTSIDDLTQLHASFLAFDLATGRCEELPDFPGGMALHPRPIVLDGQVVVFPGGTYDIQQRRVANSSAVWAYERATRRWRPRAEYPFAVRGLAVCALDSNRHVLVAGGMRTDPGGGNVMTGECFLYDAETDRFRALPALPYAAALIGAVRVGDWVYVLGGEDRARHRAAQVYRASIAELLEAAR